VCVIFLYLSEIMPIGNLLSKLYDIIGNGEIMEDEFEIVVEELEEVSPKHPSHAFVQILLW
jgi:hypothetical protein